jgi:hypothetical protein
MNPLIFIGSVLAEIRLRFNAGIDLWDSFARWVMRWSISST